MKINWNRKYNTYAAYACIVGAAIICCIFLGIYVDSVAAFFGRVLDIVAPIFYGAAIAYIMTPVENLFEKKVFKKLRPRMFKRAISMVLTYAIFISVAALLIYAVIPQLVRSFNDLQSSLIVYSKSLQDWVDSIKASSPIIGDVLQKMVDSLDLSALEQPISSLLQKIYDLLSSLSPYVVSMVGDVMLQIKNIILGIIFSAYFLASKELVIAQSRKILRAVLADEKYKKLSYFIRFTDKTFGRYLLGTMLDSIFVGLEFFAVMNIFDIPYAPLVSVVCGFTNMIPIFGPFIGAIPSFLIIFISNPIKALWFVLIVLAIQQIDGNIIAPRIIGESTGLSAIAVISSVTVMGGLFGIIGMVIGVPLFAVFANLINQKTDEKISAREAEHNLKAIITENAAAVSDGSSDTAHVAPPLEELGKGEEKK